MKLSKYLLLFGAFSIAGSAFAMNPDVDTTVTVKGTQKIQASYVGPDDFRELGGSYLLDNGKTLTITQKQSRYYAEISGQSVVQIIPRSNFLFVAADNSIKLQFQAVNDGKSTKVNATYSETLN
ncbi:hypothetical protein [Undibacterium sp. Di24W]|uniref:hypothetical protein n=1 Tax=Undibacterium sp. Di24W TaxID=3413033 RepID=UPI003BF37CF7